MYFYSTGFSISHSSFSVFLHAFRILYNKIRPYLKKVARPNFSGLCSADMYPLTPQKDCYKDFLYYLLLSDTFTAYAIKNSERAGMPKLNRTSLFAFQTMIPPIDQQISSAARIDSFSEKCDILNEQYANIVNHCSELKQQILAKAFNGEL